MDKENEVYVHKGVFGHMNEIMSFKGKWIGTRDHYAE
jgi:hypothetical protein